MAGKDYNINIKINGADSAQKDLGKVSQSVNDLAKETTNTSNSTNNLASSFKASSAIMVAGTAAIAAGMALVSKSIQVAAEKEVSLAKLSNVLKTTGSYSQEAMEDFKSFADVLQKTQNVDDDVTLSLISLGKQFGLTNSQVKEMTTAAIKLSATTGQDVQTAFITLNGTLEGSVGKLAKLGNGLGNLTTEQLKSGDAIKIINKNFADNSALVNTAAGKYTQAQLALDDMYEELGNVIINNTNFQSAMSASVKSLNAFIDNVKNNEGTLAKSVNYIFGGLVSGVKGFMDALTITPLEKLNEKILETEATINKLKSQKGDLKKDASVMDYILGNEREIALTGKALDTELEKQKAHLSDLKQQYKDLATHKNAAIGTGTSSGGNTGGGNSKNKLSTEDSKSVKETSINKAIFEENLTLEQEYNAKVLQLNEDKKAGLIDSEFEYQRQMLEAQQIYEEEKLGIQLAADMNNAALIDNKYEREKTQQAAQQKYELDLVKSKNKNAQQNAKNSLEYEKLTDEQRKQNMSKTLGTISGLMSSSNEEMFAIGKAAAIAQATMDGYQAVQTALASAPPPFNYALAAAVGIASASNIAKIAETKMQRKEFGGIINGGSVTGDMTTIRANKDEMVLTKNQQANLLQIATNGGGLGNAELLVDIRNVLAEKDFTVNIDGEKMNKKLTEINNRRLT